MLIHAAIQIDLPVKERNLIIRNTCYAEQEASAKPWRHNQNVVYCFHAISGLILSFLSLMILFVSFFNNISEN